jgi:hypothetical protein
MKHIFLRSIFKNSAFIYSFAISFNVFLRLLSFLFSLPHFYVYLHWSASNNSTDFNKTMKERLA